MAGPSGLCVRGADISRTLMEIGEDSGSTNFIRSNDSDVDYAGRELE
jgi:hypothetical protein